MTIWLDLINLNISLRSLDRLTVAIKWSSKMSSNRWRSLIYLFVILQLGGCSEDHVEKCVQAGIKSWKVNQAWYAEEARKKAQALEDRRLELLKNPNKLNEECEEQAKRSGSQHCFQNLSDFGLEFAKSELKKESPPDTIEAAEFRIRGYCLSQASKSQTSSK